MNFNTISIIILGILILCGQAMYNIDTQTKMDIMLAQLNTIQMQTVDCYPHPETISGNIKLKEKE